MKKWHGLTYPDGLEAWDRAYRKLAPEIAAAWVDLYDDYLLNELTKLEKPMPMHRFKAKMMIHFAYTPQYHFLQCLNPHDNRRSEFDRAKMYHRFCRELLDEEMIEAAAGVFGTADYRATEKGRIWVNAALSTPLPVRAKPEWVMPNA